MADSKYSVSITTDCTVGISLAWLLLKRNSVRLLTKNNRIRTRVKSHLSDQCQERIVENKVLSGKLFKQNFINIVTKMRCSVRLQGIPETVRED